jgi:flagellar biosynthesis protein
MAKAKPKPSPAVPAQGRGSRRAGTQARAGGTADVPPEAVDKDDRQAAVALTYEVADGAPRVVAKGQGLVAQEIIRRAREAGVFVHESPQLVSLLMQVNLDERIPPALYVAVAELLTWIYQVEQGVVEPAASERARPGAAR